MPILHSRYNRSGLYLAYLLGKTWGRTAYIKRYYELLCILGRANLVGPSILLFATSSARHKQRTRQRVVTKKGVGARTLFSSAYAVIKFKLLQMISSGKPWLLNNVSNYGISGWFFQVHFTIYFNGIMEVLIATITPPEFSNWKMLLAFLMKMLVCYSHYYLKLLRMVYDLNAHVNFRHTSYIQLKFWSYPLS